MSGVPGVDVPKVANWLETNVVGATGPFHFDMIAGGHSNMTFKVTGSDGARFVLRRPPLGHVLASAHDMGREHRIISALRDTDVPVAPAVGFCDDISVNGSPFYVMSFVDGLVLRDRSETESRLTPAARQLASESLVDTMAAIHAIDPASVGLGDLGRHDGYIARQLKRWYSQWNQQKTRDLNNCMVDSSGNVIAVLDWEICTLGDPMADLGLLMVYWNGPDDSASAWNGSACSAPGFLNRADLAERYTRVSGRDTSKLDFYVAFAYWKLACILEGVYARYVGGALGERDASELEPFNRQVMAAAENAERLVETLR